MTPPIAFAAGKTEHPGNEFEADFQVPRVLVYPCFWIMPLFRGDEYSFQPLRRTIHLFS